MVPFCDIRSVMFPRELFTRHTKMKTTTRNQIRQPLAIGDVVYAPSHGCMLVKAEVVAVRDGGRRAQIRSYVDAGLGTPTERLPWHAYNRLFAA